MVISPIILVGFLEEFHPVKISTFHLLSSQPQALHQSKAVDVNGNEVSLEVKGRHDPCVAIRAVPIAEAMCALCILDHYLRNAAQCSDVNQKLPFNS